MLQPRGEILRELQLESVIEEHYWIYLYHNFGLYKSRIEIFLNYKIVVKSEFSPGNCLIKFSDISLARSNYEI